MKIQVINVKLPFIEAIEILKDEENAIGCVCLDDSRPCVIVLNEKNELRVVEEELFQEEQRDLNTLTNKLLSLDNILAHQWNIIFKLTE